MKKNISPVCSLLSLPLLTPCFALSMEKEKQNPMAESVIVVPETKKRGLGVVRSIKDFIWNEEDNIYTELEKKEIDLTNSSYHRKLDTTVEIFVEKENCDKLAKMFALCRTNYPKQIKIGDTQAIMAHKFLIKENKKRQALAKEAIQKTDKQYLEQQNELLNKAKKDILDTLTLMQKLNSEHQQTRNNLITNECNEIREVKNASINLHKLNKTFQLPENEADGYCSDNEQDKKNPDNVKKSYSDANILKKIEIAAKIEETNEKINIFFVHLNDLISKLNAIKSLEY